MTAEFLERNGPGSWRLPKQPLRRSHARHYETAGESEVRRRMEALFDHMLQALTARDGRMLAYAEEILGARVARRHIRRCGRRGAPAKALDKAGLRG
jgi:hypothetical protein